MTFQVLLATNGINTFTIINYFDMAGQIVDFPIRDVYIGYADPDIAYLHPVKTEGDVKRPDLFFDHVTSKYWQLSCLSWTLRLQKRRGDPIRNDYFCIRLEM